MQVLIFNTEWTIQAFYLCAQSASLRSKSNIRSSDVILEQGDRVPLDLAGDSSSSRFSVEEDYYAIIVITKQ